jgi:formylglycine-generating enzyme required for sulfatase activity
MTEVRIATVEAEQVVTSDPPPPPDPVRALLDGGNYAEAVAMLEPWAREGDTSAALLLGEIVETAAAPRDLRFQAAGVLTKVGDPRHGVCTLPPAMVRIEGGTFVIGNPKGQEKYEDEINDKPMTIAPFEIARNPITNAQYKLFIDDDGYNLSRPWWDEAGRAWLENEKVQQLGIGITNDLALV